MENLPVFYQGSSIALTIRARDIAAGAPVDLSQFDAEATVYTRIQGNKVRLSTADPEKLELTRIDDQTLGANIPPEATAKFLIGICTIQLGLIHKETRARLVTAAKLLLIKHAI